GNASFAGQVGSDPFGAFLVDALRHYGVDTSHTAIHPTAPTTLAFVFLDSDGERSFSFRRDNTADVILRCDQVHDSWFAGKPLVHYCSNTLTTPSIAEVTQHVVAEARRHGCFLSFDVNLRHNLWGEGKAGRQLVNDLVMQSDIVKFSAEELEYLCHGERQDYLANCFSAGVSAVLITDGPGDVVVHTAASRHIVVPPAVEVVDTTGGGDAFIAGVLHGLCRQTDPAKASKDIARLCGIVAFAAHCGAFAVGRKGAFPSFPEFEAVQRHWQNPA
ncbi:MAG: carbohydrate kinase, partial [Pseudomonadota bacterium]